MAPSQRAHYYAVLTLWASVSYALPPTVGYSTNVWGDGVSDAIKAFNYNVMDFGAKGDGIIDDTAAITRAYAACAIARPRAGAGNPTVLFPSGYVFATSALTLACNNSVTRIEEGAVIRAIQSTDAWPFGPDCPEPAQGRTPRQMAPLLHVKNGKNMRITGGGSVDAHGEMWWSQSCGNWWCPPGYNHTNPKAFRPFLLRIDSSESIHIDNITMLNPGFWNLVPVHSRYITITNVNVSAQWSQGAGKDDPFKTPNTDGFEPMWTKDMIVRGCRVKNGDDCMTIKSGSSNILVEDLYCEHSDGVTIGSVWYDDVRNVTYRGVVMNRTHNGPMIKGRSQGNATVADITFEDILLIDVYLALTIDCIYETQGSVQKNIGVVAHNITFRNITGTVMPRESSGFSLDPSMITDAAGSFICLPGRPCSLELVDISFEHKNISMPSPPLWLCNNSLVDVVGNIVPPLDGACIS